jgi:hypothetical protein
VPYRHPADVQGYTARHWSVSEWAKVYVRACQWLPWTRANTRWNLVQRRRQVAEEARMAWLTKLQATSRSGSILTTYTRFTRRVTVRSRRP